MASPRFMVVTGEGKVAYGPDNEAACTHWAVGAMKRRGGAYFVEPMAPALSSAMAKLHGSTKTPAELDAEIDAFSRGVSERAARARAERKRRTGVRPGGKRDV